MYITNLPVSCTVPDGPPLNLTASSVNSSAILLTWFEPLIPNGIVVSFTIMYSTSGAVQQSGTITIPNSRRFTVTGLYAGRVYEFSLLASTRVGPGPIATAVARTEQLSEYTHYTEWRKYYYLVRLNTPNIDIAGAYFAKYISTFSSCTLRPRLATRKCQQLGFE